jgi:hypothetical protein
LINVSFLGRLQPAPTFCNSTEPLPKIELTYFFAILMQSALTLFCNSTEPLPKTELTYFSAILMQSALTLFCNSTEPLPKIELTYFSAILLQPAPAIAQRLSSSCSTYTLINYLTLQ